MTAAELDPATAIGLARSLQSLLEAAQHRLIVDSDSALIRMVTDHIGCPISEIPNVTASWPEWEHANLQRGVDAYLAEHSPDTTWFGMAGGGRSHEDLIDALASARRHGSYELGAVDYVSVPVGPDRSVDAVRFGLVRTVAPDGAPVVVAVRRVAHEFHNIGLQVLAAERATATATRERIEHLMRQHDVFRGQILGFGSSEYHGNGMVGFEPRPTLDSGDVVLAPGVLETVERHVVLAGRRAESLRSVGQHLKRGLLLHGPPGTGKTHTVRYLMSRLVESTVVVVSGEALRAIGPATALARRLQPSVVVVEDVDLIAEDRSFHRDGQPLLFELLNQMDGVGADADVTFVLTTNRVDVLEKALVDRPGRIDLAVEIPLPDADCRERLVRLYAKDVVLDLPDASRVVGATGGVTASFVRELVRRSVLSVIDDDGRLPGDRPLLTEATLLATLDELLNERNALTRVILGGGPA